MSSNQEHPFIQEAKKKNDLATFNAINMANASIYMRKLYQLQKSWEPMGKDVQVLFTLPAKKAIQIDFEDNSIWPGDSLSPGTIINLPSKPLFSLAIHNYGPGRIRFATNPQVGRLEAESELEPSEEQPFSANNPAFHRINLVTPDDSEAKIKVVGLI